MITHGIKIQVNIRLKIKLKKKPTILKFYVDPKKKEPSSIPSPIWISEELQPWPDKPSTRFKTIGALYSEFIALSENGELHQWRWSDLEPYKSDVSTAFYKNSAVNFVFRISTT